MSRLWVIAYDISDNKSRRFVHDTLKDHGERVQFSVFECYLMDAELKVLRNMLLDLLDEDDSLRWYPLCQWCGEAIDWQGTGWSSDNEDFFLI